MLTLLKKYLKKNGYNLQIESFEDLFLSHPNYPSLFAITDSLNSLSIENIAVKIPKEQFPDLPENFLGMYQNKMVLVSKKSDFVEIETEEGKYKKLTYQDFLIDWTQVIIAIEPNISAPFKKEHTRLKWTLNTIPFIALISISIYYNTFNLNSYYTTIINSIGFLVSILILQEKFGIKNEMTSKFCNFNTNLSCNSVLTSKNNKVNNYLNFTDLPLLFFGTNLLYTILRPTESTLIISLISWISIPILLYSFWLQKFKLKKWCVLCLVVSSLIALQSFTVFFNDFTLKMFLELNFSFFFFSIITTASTWLYLKPVLEKKFDFESKNLQLNKFKRNFNLFQFLSKDIEEYDDFEKLIGIKFGRENAAVQLTLILSPSCGHCHKAFKDAYELYQKFSEKLYLNILFNINPENNDNPYKIVAENLLALNEHNPKKAQEAIIDWHINQLDLENWKKKWTVETPFMLINQQILNQYYWCMKNEFNYTPIKIINGELFPESYEISDLKYFINDFNHEMEVSLQAAV